METFLQHEISIWKELFVSPFTIPIALTALYSMRGDEELTSWIGYCVRLLMAFLWLAFCTIPASLLMTLIGTQVSMSAVLAMYPLVFHFGLSGDALNSILAQSNF